jgi:predicted Zn-dependent peptidase
MSYQSKYFNINSFFDKSLEKSGWTYSIRTNCYSFGNFYEFSIECSNFSPMAVGEMEKIVNDCIEKIGSDKDLFEKIKNREISNCNMLDLTAEDLCDSVSNDLMTKQRIITHTEFLADLQATSLEDIKNILNWLESKRRWTGILIP